MYIKAAPGSVQGVQQLVGFFCRVWFRACVALTFISIIVAISRCSYSPYDDYCLLLLLAIVMVCCLVCFRGEGGHAGPKLYAIPAFGFLVARHVETLCCSVYVS